MELVASEGWEKDRGDLHGDASTASAVALSAIQKNHKSGAAQLILNLDTTHNLWSQLSTRGSTIQKGLMLKLALVRVTTRIVLRRKKCEALRCGRQDRVQNDLQMTLSLIANRLQDALSRPSRTTPSIGSL